MRLVFKESGHGISLGTTFKHEDGKTYTVVGIEQPRHGGSAGHVTCKPTDDDDAFEQRYYTSVWNMEFIEREDRATVIRLEPHQVDNLHTLLDYAPQPSLSDLKEFLDNNVIASITLSIVTR